MSLAKPRLKLVFARPMHSDAHAKELVQRIEASDRRNTYEPKPRGVPHYAALIPELCDDCGMTYWTRTGAQFTNHIGCSGAPPKGGAPGF